jgi:type IV secretion system protein VirB10
MSNGARKLHPVPDMPEEGEGQAGQEGDDRGIPSVNAKRTGVPRGVVGVAVVGALLAAGGLTYMAYAKAAKNKASAESAKDLQASVPSKTFALPRGSERVAPPSPPPPELPQAMPPSDPLGLNASGAADTRSAFGGGGGGSAAGTGMAPRAAAPRPPPPTIDKGSSGLMVASASPAPVGVQDARAVGAGAQRAEDSGPLGSMLKSSSTGVRVATVLKNRDFLLTKGTYIDCALQTKIDTTVAGMTMCVVSRDVYSDTGKTLLVDRGSQITGEYQANMVQGQSRVFVVWNRIKTPAGVVVDIDSPGVDPLGASGVDGYVDNKFLQRFGGAIMLSLISDVGTAVAGAVNAASGTVGVTLNTTTSTGQGMAAEALKNTINIQPSLVKNQGDRVGILIARDLDFSTVYALENEGD